MLLGGYFYPKWLKIGRAGLGSCFRESVAGSSCCCEQRVCVCASLPRAKHEKVYVRQIVSRSPSNCRPQTKTLPVAKSLLRGHTLGCSSHLLSDNNILFVCGCSLPAACSVRGPAALGFSRTPLCVHTVCCSCWCSDSSINLISSHLSNLSQSQHINRHLHEYAGPLSLYPEPPRGLKKEAPNTNTRHRTSRATPGPEPHGSGIGEPVASELGRVEWGWRCCRRRSGSQHCVS